MDFVLIIGYILILIIIITIHEFSHAWMANMLGDLTAKREGRLTLNPIAHIDPFLTLMLPILLILFRSPVVFGAAKPVPFNPYAVRHGKFGAALVAFAGPASNLLMAVFVGLILRFFGSSFNDGVLQFLLSFVLINLAFFVFNMIPIPPLDGSRLIYAIAPDRLAEAMEKFERMGIMVVFIVLFIAYPVLMPFISAIVMGLGRLVIGSGV